MLSIQKIYRYPIIFIFAIAGLFAFFSPVHAEGDIPPAVEQVTESQTETVPENNPAAPETPSVTTESIVETQLSEPEVITADVPVENVEPLENSTPETQPSQEEYLPADQVPAEENAEIISETPPQETITTEISAPPTGPNIAVVDQNGELLPLSTQAAEDSLIAPDPYFFVGALKYQFTTSDCDPGPDVSECADPIQAAFTYISSNNLNPDGGSVYVEPGTYYSDLVISNTMWDPASIIPASLSLIGVNSGIGIPDKTVGSSIDHLIIGSISVLGIKSFTLQAFTINGTLDGSGRAGTLVNFDSNTGTLNLIDVDINNAGTGNGLVVVNHQGAVNLNTVDSSDNGRYGGYIVNTTGIPAPVSIRNSSFDRNGIEGLYIQSNGAVTLNGVSASANLINGGATIASKGLNINQSVFNNNETDGLWIDPFVLGGNIFIQNSQFNNNTRNGLFIRQDGNVDIKNIRAMGNGESGLIVDTCNWNGNPSNYCWNPYTGNVSVTNSTFSGNAKTGVSGVDPLDGVNILAKGTITLTDVISSNNGIFTDEIDQPAYGARLNNQYGAVASVVNVTNSSFVGNYLDGLNVNSKGIIIVKDITSTGNSSNGVYLNNAFAESSAGISILNSPNQDNFISENLGYGLKILSNGAVVSNAVKADKNAESGIYVDNHSGVGSITIDGVYGNSANNNGNDGVQAISRGLITVKNMDAEQNARYGFNLNNLTGTGGISILSTLNQWINGLNENREDGLHVLSNGAVIVQKSATTNNLHFGVFIDNSSGIGAVSIADCSFNSNGTTPAENPEYGLYVKSKGNISLTNVSANFNGFDDPFNINDVITNGAWLNNSFSSTPKSVTINRGSFNNNFGSGLDVYSKGTITMTFVEANENTSGYGAYINNGGSGGTGTVTISGKSADDKRTFSGNSVYGLQIISNANVSLKYADAKNNGSYGAFIDNSSAATPLSVSITSAEFSNNSQTTNGFGLRVFSKGAITSASLRSDNNGNLNTGITGNGLELDNCRLVLGLCTGTGGVTLTGVSTSGNNGNGLDIQSYGAITISNALSRSNNGNGANVFNNTSKSNPNPSLSPIPSVGGVSITMPAGYPTSIGMFSDNGGFGLSISSNGAVALTNINVTNNDSADFAAFIDNSTSMSAKPVTISKSRFNDNFSIRGIKVVSNGAIIFTNNEVKNNIGTADINQGAAELDNLSSTLPQNVTVTFSRFQNNSSGDGLLILTKGNVLLTSVSAYGNNNEGIDVNASYGLGTITVNGSQNSFLSNGGNGLKLLANGNVTVSNITSENNDEAGLAIMTYGEDGTGLGTGTITVTNANLNMNKSDGIKASANGIMNLNNITSLGNGIGSNSDGAHLVTNAKNITITGSCFSGNEGSGIWSDTGAGNTLKVVGTMFYGNNTGGVFDPNIYNTGLATII